MKTHEVAATLQALAKALKRAPDIDLEDIGRSLVATARHRPDTSDIPFALSALVALSKFDKAQWRTIIEEFKLPIEVRHTESTRDVVGKILRVLERDAEARRRLQMSVKKSRPDISPELMNALNFLLK